VRDVASAGTPAHPPMASACRFQCAVENRSITCSVDGTSYHASRFDVVRAGRSPMAESHSRSPSRSIGTPRRKRRVRARSARCTAGSCRRLLRRRLRRPRQLRPEPPAPVSTAISRTFPTSAKPNERRRQPPKPADRRADAKATGNRRAAQTSPPRPSPPRPPAPSPSPRRIGPAPDPTRAPRHENPHDPRLSKRMSELGLCSRREADEWIENGWVKVDGTVVTTLGLRVSPRARIDIDPAAARHQSEQVTILLNSRWATSRGRPRMAISRRSC